jgi:hypothetical protein
MIALTQQGSRRIASQPDTWVEDGKRYFRTLAGLAQCFDISTRAIRDWKEKGCPLENGRYCLPEVIAWRDGWQKRSAPDPEEMELMGGDSPALERLREEKYQLARLDRLERERQLVRVDDLLQPLMEAAAVVRAAGERIGRDYGPEAQEIVNEAVGEFVGSLKAIGSDGD